MDIDKIWHLSQTPEEIRVTEFELHLWRVFSGFMSWVEECERYVNNTSLTGHDLAVLHIVRMKDRPKSINDISRILNRSDIYNMQYTIRKLIKIGLIEKNQLSSGHRKSATYQMTQKGIEATDRFLMARRKILIDLFAKNPNSALEEITNAIIHLKSIYDNAAQIAASCISIPESQQVHKEDDNDDDVKVEE